MKLLLKTDAKTIFERATVRFSLLFVLCIGLGDIETANAQDKLRPNVLFIAVDDLTAWVTHLGRNPQAKTPNIDRLAKMGTTLLLAAVAGRFIVGS